MMRNFRPVAATFLLFLAFYFFCIFRYPSMASLQVAGNLLTDNAFLGIAAVGATFVIISGGIDLSIGATIGFTGVLNAILIQSVGLHPLFAFAISLAIATLFGAGMGSIIHYLRMPSFIVTLAGMFLARGCASILSEDSLPVSHPFLKLVTAASIALPGGGKLTVLAQLMILCFIAGGVVLHRTRFGSYVFALGGNAQSAALMGIPVARTTVKIYALSSFMAALAGIAFTLYTSSGYSLAATGVELDAIAAVVIGGTVLNGGYGSMLGTFIGVLLQGLVQTYIVFDGTLNSWWTKIVIGLLLLLFILLQKLFHGPTSLGHQGGSGRS